MGTIGMNKPEMIDGIDKYKVENAAETLMRAQEIMADSKLKSAAMKILKKKKAATEKAVSWADGLRNG